MHWVCVLSDSYAVGVQLNIESPIYPKLFQVANTRIPKHKIWRYLVCLHYWISNTTQLKVYPKVLHTSKL